jgi:hypothetical protein
VTTGSQTLAASRERTPKRRFGVDPLTCLADTDNGLGDGVETMADTTVKDQIENESIPFSRRN